MRIPTPEIDRIGAVASPRTNITVGSSAGEGIPPAAPRPRQFPLSGPARGVGPAPGLSSLDLARAAVSAGRVPPRYSPPEPMPLVKGGQGKGDWLASDFDFHEARDFRFRPSNALAIASVVSVGALLMLAAFAGWVPGVARVLKAVW